MDVDFHLYVKLFFTSLVFILVALKTIAAKRASKPNLPPGPWKLPVIGNIHHLLMSSLPHHRLRDLARKHGDLMHLQLGELSHVIVSSAEAASEMMRTHDANFSQKPFFLGGSFYDFKGPVLAPFGDYWRELRKICVQELMSNARVRSFRSIREDEVNALVNHLRSASGSPVNLSEKVVSMTYNITAKAAFGKSCRNQEAFISSAMDSLKLSGGLSVSELFPSQKWLQRMTGIWPKVEKLWKIMDAILEDIIDNVRADRAVIKSEDQSTKSKSLLDVLFDIQEKGNLTIPMENKNIKAIILDLFVAGSDTSSATVAWVMFELSRNPTVMEKAQAEVRRVFGGDKNIVETRLHELKYLSFVIKEAMRLRPPGPLIPRESIGSCVMKGYDIPAKTKFLVNAWAIGRDPRYWSDPEKFLPERFTDSDVDFKGTDFEFIPFGAGRRMCPGVSFAMHNIELSLAHLLFHFDWKLPNGIDARKNEDVIESFGLTVRLKDDLYLIPVPRTTTSVHM